MKHILVTGASGFIGSHMVKLLVEKGYGVIAFVRYKSDSSIGNLRYLTDKVLEEVEIVYGDLTDYQFMRTLMVNEPDYIVHLAAIIDIPYSFECPVHVFSNNIAITKNVLDVATDYNVPLVHISTSEVYGNQNRFPIPETAPLRPQSPYAASKAACEHLIQSYLCAAYGTRAVVLRLFNCYGEGQSERAVIPAIIKQMLKDGETITLGDINTERDFTHVGHTCEAILSCLERFKRVNGEIINIGSGRSIQIKTIVSALEKVHGRPFKLIAGTRSKMRPPFGEVQKLIADNTKARKLLKWQPEKGYRFEQVYRWFERDSMFPRMIKYGED